jgi:methionyl aminopeptidase
MSLRIFHKSKEEIAKLRAVNLIVSAVLDACEAACKPGVSTMDLNDIADDKLKSLGATSAFLGYHGYPAVLCTSVNEVVVHGIPRKDVVLKDGDIIGIDFGCFKEGFCGDSARTLAIGDVSDEAKKLMAATKESLDRAIEQCKPGNRLQDIGWAVQSHVEPMGYSVVRTFVGHGIGRAMHEDPPVPNYGSPGKGLRLKPGWVLAIEPMVNAGTHEVEVLADGWTAVTKDRKLSAHFEHSVAITEEGPFVLSRA